MHADYLEKLQSFIESWEHSSDIQGILVSGSIVTGFATEASDLDVHIILRPECSYRTRGNVMVDGLLIEYFANTGAQIQEYFESEKANMKLTTARMFAIGDIVQDTDNTVHKLKEQAVQRVKTPFNPTKISLFSLYALWDKMDNLKDLYTRNDPLKCIAYYDLVFNLLQDYSKSLGVILPSISKLHQYFTNPQWREAYLMPEFPDSEFVSLFLRLSSERLEAAEALYNHVNKQAGGFDIATFKL